MLQKTYRYQKVTCTKIKSNFSMLFTFIVAVVGGSVFAIVAAPDSTAVVPVHRLRALDTGIFIGKQRGNV